jgi:hypothetical protein
MFNPNASSIEHAVILFALFVPGFALFYLMIYFAVYMLRRRRRARAMRSGLSLLDVIGRQ